MVFELAINFAEPFDLFFLARFLAFALLWSTVWFDFSISYRRKAIKVCLLWCSQNLTMKGERGFNHFATAAIVWTRMILEALHCRTSYMSIVPCRVQQWTWSSFLCFLICSARLSYYPTRSAARNQTWNSTLCSFTSIRWRSITFLRTQL